MLTLNERTYLSECIDKVSPDLKDKSYEIAGAFTRPQRSLFLSHFFKRNFEACKEMVENITSFQTKIT